MRNTTKQIRASEDLDKILREITQTYGLTRKQASDLVATQLKTLITQKGERKNAVKSFRFW